MCPYRHPSERNEAMGSTENQERTDVVIAAGGWEHDVPNGPVISPRNSFPCEEFRELFTSWMRSPEWAG